VARDNRMVRLFNMIFYIQNNPGCTAEELARRCGVSLRQCYRDLRTIQDAGFPLYHDRGYRMIEGSMLKAIAFTMEEALALIYGIKLLEQQKGIIKAPGQVKEKLLALLPKAFSNEIERIGQRVEIEVAPAADYSGKESIFRTINEAIKNHTVLQMKYYSFSRDEVTDRLVEPYQLVFKDGFWYLVAFCHRNQETRLFRIDRIRGLERTEQTFTPPADYSYEEYMGAAWQMERGEEFPFKVRFFFRSARFVRETNFHPSQEITEEPGGTVIFTAKACSLRSILRWILTFGDEAEVLEPPELRTMVVKTMAAGLKRYSGIENRKDENGNNQWQTCVP